MQNRPLSTFPGIATPEWDRKRSPFSAPWSQTLELLDKELWHLDAQNVYLESDVRESDIRLDGMLRANASPKSSTIIISFDSKHGPLRYGCDRFTKWQDNVRAVALGLEALRRVERYGIAKRGEQYQGYRALGSGIAMGPSTMTADEAARFVQKYAPDFTVEDILEGYFDSAYRIAVKQLHPDTDTGDEAAFKKLQDAKAILENL